MASLRLITRGLVQQTSRTSSYSLFYRAPVRSALNYTRFQSTKNNNANDDTNSIIDDVPGAKLYTYQEVKNLVTKPDPAKLLVDVREPEELNLYGSIPTSINIPFKSTPGALDLPEEDFEDLFGIEKPSKDKELIFFCQAGLRSAAAEELIGTFGYKKRGNYAGSFNDWYENENANKSGTNTNTNTTKD